MVRSEYVYQDPPVTDCGLVMSSRTTAPAGGDAAPASLHVGLTPASEASADGPLSLTPLSITCLAVGGWDESPKQPAAPATIPKPHMPTAMAARTV